MARIIFSVIFLVALVILIVMNIGSIISVNVFGWRIEELSVTVVGLVSFVAGVVYSFIFYLISYLERGRRERLARRTKKLKDQAADLKTREQEVGDLAQESKQQLQTAIKMQTPVAAVESPAGARGGLSGLFGRKKQPAELSQVDEVPDSAIGSNKKKKK